MWAAASGVPGEEESGSRMVGVYFSGTGNSRHVLDVFLKAYDETTKSFSIEDNGVLTAIKEQDTLVFAYPVQYSTVPKILSDFICENKEFWNGKKVFVIATMGLFSGDGAGVLARLLQKYGAKVLGGIHIKMPDSIGDEKVLKRSLEKNKELVKRAEEKVKMAATCLKNGKPTKEGFGFFSRMLGFFGQRLYFGNKTKNYSGKLKIDVEKCVGCGKCVVLCPMKNISIKDGVGVSEGRCTMCYRCVNNCPRQAITLLGKEVVEQSVIEKYL